MKKGLSPAKPRFPWSLWYWTNATENLFDLQPVEIHTFKHIISEANKHRKD